MLRRLRYALRLVSGDIAVSGSAAKGKGVALPPPLLLRRLPTSSSLLQMGHTCSTQSPPVQSQGLRVQIFQIYINLGPEALDRSLGYMGRSKGAKCLQRALGGLVPI